MNQGYMEHAIRTSDTKCLFAEDFVVGSSVRSTNPDKKGKVRKEGIVKIFLFDAATQKVISEVALTSISAKLLADALNNTVVNLEKELLDTKPKKPKKQESQHYMG